jgi:hypothetical protein
MIFAILNLIGLCKADLPLPHQSGKFFYADFRMEGAWDLQRLRLRQGENMSNIDVWITTSEFQSGFISHECPKD